MHQSSESNKVSGPVTSLFTKKCSMGRSSSNVEAERFQVMAEKSLRSFLEKQETKDMVTK